MLSATHVLRSAGRIIGAVYGLVSAEEAARIVAAIRASDDPGWDAPEVPWAALALRPDGSVVATASMMLSSGIFHWRRDDTGADGTEALPDVLIATDPLAIWEAVPGEAPPTLDWEYLLGFARGNVHLTRTPFRGISRVPAGRTARWDRARDAGQVPPARITEWCGPSTLPEPWRQGADVVEEYAALFDEVVTDAASRLGPLVAQVSGGLDSTFVAAALARLATRDRPVLGLCHSPLPGRGDDSLPGWVQDDLPYAELMSARYPDRLRIEAVRNDALVHPLDAAAESGWLSGVPSYAPANQVWLNATQARAAAAGAQAIFVGTWGNAAFSHPHGYAGAYYRGSGRYGQLAGMVWDTIRRDGPRQRASLRRLAAAAGRGAGEAGLRRRQEYLHLLTDSHGGFSAAMNPASRVVAGIDPYRSRRIVQLAAAIEPRVWQQGPLPRAFARRAGAGRVPDEIRFRLSRGRQAADALSVWRAFPERAEAALAALAEHPEMAALADELGTREKVSRLLSRSNDPRRAPLGTAALSDLNQTARVLAVAEHAARLSRCRRSGCWWETHCRRIPRSS